MRFISTPNLKVGQKLAQDLMMDNTMLLGKGYPLTEQNIYRMKTTGMPGVYIDDELSKGIEIAPPIRFEAIENGRKQMKNLLQSTQNDDKFSKYLTVVDKASATIVDECLESLDTIINVVDLKTYDGYLYQHSTSVAILATAIGVSMGYKREALLDLSKGAMLHDVGKTFIDQTLMNKPDHLTPEEFEIIKHHTRLGYDYLEKFWDVSISARIVSILHHERVDGTGYPLGYTGQKIHDFGKIVSIADVYDALTSERPYKTAYPPHKALAYINENLNTMFDPRIAEYFFLKIAPYPLGTCVRLSDGTDWIVTEQNPGELDRPILMGIENGKQNDITLDLSAEDSLLYVMQVVDA